MNTISFPEHEYESIQNYLNGLGYCYTTRVYKEVFVNSFMVTLKWNNYNC